eukprot:jgi/Undpi1/12602/HiC_scaffold_6.g02271.m1
MKRCDCSGGGWVVAHWGWGHAREGQEDKRRRMSRQKGRRDRARLRIEWQAPTEGVQGASNIATAAESAAPVTTASTDPPPAKRRAVAGNAYERRQRRLEEAAAAAVLSDSALSNPYCKRAARYNDTTRTIRNAAAAAAALLLPLQGCKSAKPKQPPSSFLSPPPLLPLYNSRLDRNNSVNMQYCYLFLVVLTLLGSALGFQVAPRGSLTATSRAVTSSAFGARSYAAASSRATALAGSKRRQWAIMQFGDGGGPIERGTMPSYEEEQEKAFFNSELDNAPAKEKVKDPLVLITLGWIVGMFVLAAAFIVNGVN